MSPKYIEFNKYLERCKKRTHLSYYDYHTILLLASMQCNDYSQYSKWQTTHDVTNQFFNEPEEPREVLVSRESEWVFPAINNVSDLISVADQIKLLKQIKPELEQLNSMVGMQTIKSTIVNQILYYLQNMHIGGNDYRHIVITGPPGTGKTEIAKLMGAIFSKLCDQKLLSQGDQKLPSQGDPIFKKATRSDLIAGYVGQTAIKTKALIEKCLNGVLFIDEAYSFGDDTFSKECADTLCESLSSYKDNLTVIIAGYEDQLNQQFFALNPGLESRFSWRYSISGYNASELHAIFALKVQNQGWKLEQCCVPWFQKHCKEFTGYGRDMDTLLFKVKVAHSRRVFSGISGATSGISRADQVGKKVPLAEAPSRETLFPLEKKLLTVADLDAGLKVFMEHKNTNANHIQKSLSLMYA